MTSPATVNPKALAGAAGLVRRTAKAIGGSRTLREPFTLRVEGGRLTFVAADAEVETSVEASGRLKPVQIPPHVLSAALKQFDTSAGDIELTLDDSTKDARYLVAAQPSASRTVRLRAFGNSEVEWPSLPEPDGDPVVLGAGDIAAIRAALAYVSTDEARPVLCALHLMGGHVGATDSYRLCRFALDGLPEGFEALVNGPAANAVATHGRNGKVTVTSWDDDYRVRLSTEAGGVALTVRNAQVAWDSFPNLDNLIAAARRRDGAQVTVDLLTATALADTVERHAKISSSYTVPTDLFASTSGYLNVHTGSNDVGIEATEVIGGIDWPTDRLLAVNARYLHDVLTTCLDADGGTIRVPNAHKGEILTPVVFESADGRRTALQMPMRHG